MAYPGRNRLNRQMEDLERSFNWPLKDQGVEFPKVAIREEGQKFRAGCSPTGLPFFLKARSFDHRITTSLFSLINLALKLGTGVFVQANRIFTTMVQMTIYEETIVSSSLFYLFKNDVKKFVAHERRYDSNVAAWYLNRKTLQKVGLRRFHLDLPFNMSDEGDHAAHLRRVNKLDLSTAGRVNQDESEETGETSESSE